MAQQQLNPGIITAIQPPQIKTGAEALGGAMTMQRAMQQRDREQLLMDQERQKQDDQAAINEAFQMFTDDPDQAAHWLEQNGRATAASSARAYIADRRKALVESEKTELEARKQKLDLLANAAVGMQRAGSAKDITPERKNLLWQNFRQEVLTNLGQEYADTLGDAWDDDKLASSIAWGGKTQEAMDLQKKALDFAGEAIKLDGEQRDSVDAWERSIARAFAVPSNQQHWDQLYSLYNQSGPQAKKALQRSFQDSPTFTGDGTEVSFGPRYNEKTRQKFLTMAQTADQQANNARADESLAETKRHNRAMEDKPKEETPEQKAEAELPSEVRVTIARLPVKHSTNRQAAMNELKGMWADWVARYPRMKAAEVNKLFDLFYGPAQNKSSLLSEDGDVSDTGGLPDLTAGTESFEVEKDGVVNIVTVPKGKGKEAKAGFQAQGYTVK